MARWLLKELDVKIDDSLLKKVETGVKNLREDDEPAACTSCELLKFLNENPETTYKELNDEFESGVDEFLLQQAKRVATLLFGGKSKGISEEGVDPKELEMGIKVEMEHTDDPVIAKKIALDHLSELPDYYTRLKKMESKNEKNC